MENAKKAMKYTQQAIHNRFLEVLESLENRQLLIKGARKSEYSYSSFTETVFGRNHSGLLSDYRKGKRSFYAKEEHLQNLCEHYAISEDFIRKGCLPMFVNEAASVSEQKAQEPEPRTKQREGQRKEQLALNRIRFSPIGAVAGSALGAPAQEEELGFSIPGLHGNDYVAFPVHGRSMEPTFFEGDIIICRPVSLDEIQDNQLYALVSEGATVLKRVQKLYNKLRKLRGLKLISDNYIEYDPYELKLSEVDKIYKVERRISMV